MDGDFKRGLTEARQHFETLRARWPTAFPAKRADVRPLEYGVASIVAGELGWSLAYAKGVLNNWKSRDAYCHACLVYPERITLDGALSGEHVEEEARAMARDLLERRRLRDQREAERKAALRGAAPQPARPADRPPVESPEVDAPRPPAEPGLTAAPPDLDRGRLAPRMISEAALARAVRLLGSKEKAEAWLAKKLAGAGVA